MSLQPSKTGVSCTRNHCFHKCHWTTKSSEIEPKTGPFGPRFGPGSGFGRPKCGRKVVERWSKGGLKGGSEGCHLYLLTFRMQKWLKQAHLAPLAGQLEDFGGPGILGGIVWSQTGAENEYVIIGPNGRIWHPWQARFVIFPADLVARGCGSSQEPLFVQPPCPPPN